MHDMNLIVNEIFESIQGEGGCSGQLSIFIRLANCNMNCTFCDTD
jgi:organic radical activating enzyme